MLTKAMMFFGITIYRNSLGYYFQLVNKIKDLNENNVEWIINNYTDIEQKNLKLIVLNKEVLGNLLGEIIKFNIPVKPESKFKKTEEKIINTEQLKLGDEEIASIMIDKLASNYGWTIDYILDNVDIYQYNHLSKAMGYREKRDAYNKILVHHSPSEALKQYTSETENLSFEEGLKRLDNLPKPPKRKDS